MGVPPPGLRGMGTALRQAAGPRSAFATSTIWAMLVAPEVVTAANAWRTRAAKNGEDAPG